MKCCIEKCRDRFEHNLRQELRKCAKSGGCLKSVDHTPDQNFWNITPCDEHKSKYNMNKWGAVWFHSHNMLQWYVNKIMYSEDYEKQILARKLLMG